MKKIKNNFIKVVAFFLLGGITGIMLLVSIARLTWHSKFYPGITIAGTRVSGLTREQAKTKLLEQTENYQVELILNGSNWKTQKGMVNFEIESTLNEAYHYGRRLKFGDYLLLLINKESNFPIKIAEGKTDTFEKTINELSGVVEISPIDPLIEIVNKKIKLTNGNDGIVLDGEQFDKQIAQRFGNLDREPIVIPTKHVKRQLSSDKINELSGLASMLIDKSIMLRLDDEKIKLNDNELVSFISTIDGEKLFDKTRVDDYVTGLSNNLNKKPQDAKFEFSEGKVEEFVSGKDGIEVNLESTSDNLELGIKKLLESESKSETVEIAVIRTPPKITTEKVNELGIRERIGRGESFYQHSIPNRIYNVSLASSRLNSALIGPGEEVSFNQLVGEVSGATGYRPAYIISGGRTVLGDGGGLCQVSTTMFRAAMSAGLPILERWGHAYRVSYYELNSKPGVDATVIAPSKDFRFKNDTPGHILIQTINDPKKLHLIIEIYGTADGRVATISEPKVWGNTPPLPTIYQDDPSLPAGTVKQVDWAAPGAKASFEYKVTKNGETLQEKTFTTNYQPWASVFLRGTGQ